MVEFIKTCDNTLVGLILVFFQLHHPLPPRPSPLSAKKKISLENAVREEWVIFFCLEDNDKILGEIFPWGHE